MTSRTTPPPPAESLGTLLATTLARLAPAGDRDLLARTVRLLCRDHDQGHMCTSLRDWQQRSAEPGEPPFPALAAWREELARSGLCGDGSPAAAATPLVLDPQDRLYLLRHFRAEQSILAFVRERLAGGPLATAPALQATLRELRLLPETPAAEPDWQLAAIAAAARSRFAVLTGGPGTGKTTTVAALLAVLLHREPRLRIALAAPTGKAAARLGEALRARTAEFPQLRAAHGTLQCKTLHRLLGYLPLDDTFRHNRDRRLPHDLVVVDEASMVDPALLQALVAAMRPDARLLLVGDRDQLAAIAAGQVLGDLCRAAAIERGVGPALATFCAEATTQHLPVQPGAGPLADCVIALQKNWRFGRQPGIGTFASALARRDASTALAALAAGHADLHHTTSADAALATVADALVAAATAPDAATALRALSSVRILCASRHGPNGTIAWNRRVETLLAQHGVRTDERWYRGRPILVTANDPQNELWNGDLGVAWPDPDGRPQIVFHGTTAADGERAIVVPRLPAHETAWAMTVHKAQGSEFGTVLLVLPEVDGPLWQASLVYTGITRAQQRAVLLADAELLQQGLRRWPSRSSGLADALAGPQTTSAAAASTPP